MVLMLHGSLTCADECKPAMRDAGVLSLLTTVISSRDGEAQKYGVRAMAFMATDAACRAELERCVPER
jgi:hypothetical protein